MTDARMRTSEWHNKLLELMEDYHPIPINTDNLIMPEDFLKQCKQSIQFIGIVQGLTWDFQ